MHCRLRGDHRGGSWNRGVACKGRTPNPVALLEPLKRESHATETRQGGAARRAPPNMSKGGGDHCRTIFSSHGRSILMSGCFSLPLRFLALAPSKMEVVLVDTTSTTGDVHVQRMKHIYPDSKKAANWKEVVSD